MRPKRFIATERRVRQLKSSMFAAEGKLDGIGVEVGN